MDKEWKYAGEGIATAISLWTALRDAATSEGITTDITDWVRSHDHESLSQFFSDYLVSRYKGKEVAWTVTEARRNAKNISPVRIDTRFERLVLALSLEGRDSCVNVNNFPTEKVPEGTQRRFWEFNFGFKTSQDEVIQIMSQAGYRPATAIEFLSWLVHQASPDTGISHPVIAIGQGWNQTFVYICLAGGGGRCLARQRGNRKFDSDYSFLGVLFEDGEQPLDWAI